MATDSHHHHHVSPIVAVRSLTSSSNTTTSSSSSSSRRNSTRSRRRRSSMMLLSSTSDVGGSSLVGAAAAVADSRKQQHFQHENVGDESEQDEIAISTTGKTASKTITPFLAKHIPNTYNPMNQNQPAAGSAGVEESASTTNTKFCNRHRPDRKCRRQADGPSMDQLQSELSSLGVSDRTAISHVWSVFSMSSHLVLFLRQANMNIRCRTSQAEGTHPPGHPQRRMLQPTLLHLGTSSRPHQD
jgi:hypothetical protein